MKENTDLEQINRYLRQEFSAEEKLAFEQRLANEPQLVQEVRLQQDIVAAVTDRGTRALEQQLEQLRTKWEGTAATEATAAPSAVPRVTWWKSYTSLAAAVGLLLIACLGLYLYTAAPEQDHATLFAHYYRPATPESLRAPGDAFESTLQQAYSAYKAGDFQGAIDHFDKAAHSRPSSITIDFYLGHCYLNLNAPGKAQGYFEKVIAHHDNVFLLDAQWYLALAYLKGNATDRAISTLQPLLSKPEYADRAKALLKATKRLKKTP